MGGAGVTNKQLNTAVGGQAGLAQTGQQNMQQQQGASNAAGTQATGYYSNLAANGLPNYRQMTDYNAGNIARSFAPQRAAAYRQTAQSTNLPSGYRNALLQRINEGQGQAFDQTLTQAQIANQQAKAQGAAGLTGEQQIAANEALGYGSLAGGANQSLLYGPRKPGVLGAIGGASNQILSDVMQRPA